MQCQHEFEISVEQEQIPYGSLRNEPIFIHYAVARCIHCGTELEDNDIVNILNRHFEFSDE